jgi:deoxyribonuclease IV
MSFTNSLIGAHTSTVGGVHQALWEGQKIGATTVQLFTSNQKQWKGRELTVDSLEKWEKAREETQLTHLMSHDSYLINLGGPRIEILEKSRQAFREEIQRCLKLGMTYLNFHPGAALTGNIQECLDRIVSNLLLMKPLLDQGSLRLLLETTAGQGSTVGNCFEHLGYIIEAVKDDIPIGVCIDTCHIFVAGYDVRTAQAWEETLNLFDRLVGLQHLYAFHINDSMKGLESRVDRHQSLGEGMIGWECFKFLMTDSRTKHLPKYLETPGATPAWTKEIQQLKEFATNSLSLI